MLAVDPAHQGGGVGRAVVRDRGARPAAARHRGDQHHQRHVHGARPRPLPVLGFRRAPERDWYVPGEDVLLWVFHLQTVQAQTRFVETRGPGPKGSGAGGLVHAWPAAFPRVDIGGKAAPTPGRYRS
jgi:hypothetical protein